MPRIEYTKPINLQIANNAIIYWEIGNQSSSTLITHNDNLIGSIFDSIDRQNNPSKYTFSYGKAEQAIFITSFKDILQRQHVFSNVEIITDPKKVSAKDAFITIYFKSTRVSSPERGYKISLSVEMWIQGAGKPTFKRTYFVKSDDNSYSSFQEEQNKVSIQLAEKLIAGLTDWNNQK